MTVTPSLEKQPVRRERDGFALAMVVFLLFAAAIAGLTGYQVVSDEATLASGNERTNVAFAVAYGGIQRYVGEHIGVPGATSYPVGRGNVTVTPRRVARLNDSTELYMLEAVGTVRDTLNLTPPASRTIRQYAYLNTMPVRAVAALMAIENKVDFTANPFRVSGIDVPEAGDCNTSTSYPYVGARFSTAGI